MRRPEGVDARAISVAPFAARLVAKKDVDDHEMPVIAGLSDGVAMRRLAARVVPVAWTAGAACGAGTMLAGASYA
jgi:hypothetical protein